jgi:hypothetical protein
MVKRDGGLALARVVEVGSQDVRSPQLFEGTYVEVTLVQVMEGSQCV